MNDVNKERAVIHIKQAGKEVQVRFVGEALPDIQCEPVISTLEENKNSLAMRICTAAWPGKEL